MGEARRTRLSNGLLVVTESIPEARSLSIGILADAGPADDEPGLSGTAHFVEHLLFQGTTSRSALEIARLMDAAGGSLGAFTTRDYTCFTATVLGEFRTYALDLFGDLLLNSTFPGESIERHRGAVLAEMAADAEAPDALALALLRSHAWGSHALGRPIAGSAEDVARLTREDLIYFVHRNYTPERLVVAAAGNVDHDDFVAQSRDAFWRLLGEAAPQRPAPPPFRGGLVVTPSHGALARFAIGVPVGPYASPDRYALHLTSRILGGGLSSRLFRRVREELGLVYDIGSEVLAYRDAGLCLVEGACAPADLPRVLAETLEILAGLVDGSSPVDEEELSRCQSQLISQHLLGGESTHTRMSRLATQQLYFGAPLGEAEVLSSIAAVDVAGARAFAEGPFRAALEEAAIAVVDPLDSTTRRGELSRLAGSFQVPAGSCR